MLIFKIEITTDLWNVLIQTIQHGISMNTITSENLFDIFNSHSSETKRQPNIIIFPTMNHADVVKASLKKSRNRKHCHSINIVASQESSQIKALV